MARVWLPTPPIDPAPRFPRRAHAGCPCSAWSAGQAPVHAQVSSTSPTEVGVRFRVEKYGQIPGIRFYKGPLNTGTHKGSLWARSGTLLASATFTNETASGWQQVNFCSPGHVWPWTTYVASYFAPGRPYAADPSVFTQTEIVSSPVRLLATGQSGGNGWSVGTSTGIPERALVSSLRTTGSTWCSHRRLPAPPATAAQRAGSLRVTGTNTSSQISLAWNDVIGETGFRVERAPGGTTNWTAVGVAPRDNWVFTDTGCPRRLPTSTGSSRPAATVTPRRRRHQYHGCAAAAGGAGGGVGGGGVRLADRCGLAGRGRESGYQVQRSADGATGWAQVGATGAGRACRSPTLAWPRRPPTSTGWWPPTAAVLRRRRRWPARPRVAPSAPAGVTAAAVSSSGRCGLAGCGRGVRVSGGAVGQRDRGWAQVGPPVRM